MKNEITEVPTFWATIYVGFRVGLNDQPATRYYSMRDVKRIAQAYCDEVGLCVTVSRTTFIYTRGKELGAVVGLINYPRFPCPEPILLNRALVLAKRLRSALEQQRVSVVTPTNTYMIGNEPQGETK